MAINTTSKTVSAVITPGFSFDQKCQLKPVMLKTFNINKYFGKHHVLKDINFEMNLGEIVAIVGPSGSGKSTFLRTLNLMEIPTSGDITFEEESILYKYNNGKKIRKKEKEITTVRAEIGMVFQSFNLFPHKTALENVIEGPIRVRKYSKSDAISEGEALLEKVGLLEKRIIILRLYQEVNNKESLLQGP